MEQIAKEIRAKTFECIASIGQGHIGGSLSIVDVLTVLYYKHMNVDPKNPQMNGRDRLVVSKGHAGPAVYATLCQKGYISHRELLTLNQFKTNLPSHCDMNKTPGIDMTTGSLGQGISCAVGMAIAAKLANDHAYIYCIIGDGESQEGQVWEASMYAAQKGLDNFIVFLDNNGMQIDNYTKNINGLIDPIKKWESFGFFVQSINGNSIDEIDCAIINAKKNKGMPSMIILNTIKGKGVPFIEEAGVNNHSMPISLEQLNKALEELK
ncbi:MAG: transketolase [Christensenellales bacterium]|jgi:transketolase domain protein|nr:transketolase [Bacilli bacterium]CDC72576.1 transketolase domain protein [Staphylococcus sp. CAG:324]